MFGSRWVGNPHNRSGLAVFSLGEEEVSVELSDVDDFHRLDALVKKIADQERLAAQYRYTRRVLAALNA